MVDPVLWVLKNAKLLTCDDNQHDRVTTRHRVAISLDHSPTPLTYPSKNRKITQL